MTTQQRRIAARIIRKARKTAAMCSGPQGVVAAAWLVGWQFNAYLILR